MKKLKRGLAWMLAALMLITTLPATAMAAGLEDGPAPQTEQVSVDDMMAAIMETAVMYMDGEAAVLVVEPQYADWCQENWETLSAAGWFSEIGCFSEDGSYTIQLPEGTAFPCAVVFPNTQDDDPMVVFANVGDAQVVNSHTFVAACENPQYTDDGEPGEVDFNAGVNPLGYQYIKTVKLNENDLTDRLAGELAALPLSDLLPGVDLTNVTALAVDTSSYGATGGDGQYEVVKTEAGTIDLSGLIRGYPSNYYGYGSSLDKKVISYQLEIINSNDQLNTDATRYIVPIKLSNLNELLTLDAYFDGKQLNSSTNQWSYDYNSSYSLATDLPIWDVKAAVVSMKLNSALAQKVTKGLTAKVYAGSYLTLDEIDPNMEITDRVWNQGASGYITDWSNEQDFTVVLYRSGNFAQLLNLTVNLEYKDVDFGFDMSTVATEDAAAQKIDVTVWNSSAYRENSYYVYPQSFDTWKSGEAVLKLRYKTAADAANYDGDESDYSDYTDKTDVAVYTGYYEDETVLRAAVTANRSKDITADIWAADGAGYTADFTDSANRQAFTVVVKEKESNETAYVVPFYVYMREQAVGPVRVNVGENLYVSVPSSPSVSSTDWNRASEKWDYDGEYGTNYYTMRWYNTADEAGGERNYPRDGKYYVQFWVQGETADESYAETLAKIDRIEDGSGKDVKTAIFGSGNGNYYRVDFSQQPVVFTVYFKDETVAPQVIRLRTLPAQPPEKIQSIDTYFNVMGVEGYDTYTMPYHVDSSYQNGFQVIFVDTTVEDLESKEVTVTYSTGSNVNMFWKHNETGERIETVNKVTTSVQSGVPVLFSAASESGTHLRNYWVTFIAKQPEAKLWINGQNDTDHVDKATGLPLREVFIYNRGGSYDIFFANIGEAELTGLDVTLTSRNNNIRLDDYWTVGDTKTLAGYTTTKKHQTDNHDDYYSQLENMAKIRIWAEGQGDVDGILTITADGQAPVSIKLTGKVGQAAIVSSQVPDGVKFVPYSCLIQNNYAGRTGNDANRPTYQIVGGALPANVSINEKTGEIYGVPRAWGTFYFTVGLFQNGEMVDSRSFTMNIADNTDENVWNASDDTYKVIDPIGWPQDTSIGPNDPDNPEAKYVIDLSRYEGIEEASRTFVSEGPYLYYVKVFLDSKLLEPGVDYTSSEGSTKIVLSEGTVGGSGNNTNGSHTLAIEFRENDGETVDDQVYQGTLKRTSQNYYIEGGVNPSTPQSSGGNSQNNRPGSNSNNNSSNNNTSRPSSNTPSTPATPPVSPANSFPFGDVKVGDWYYNDVFWSWEQELMTGTTATTFEPDTQISQAMIVVVLARLIDVDLSAFENVGVAGAETGAWYTTAAAWAQQSGLLPDNSSFAGEGPLSRDGMASMMVKYLASMGVDTTVGGEITFDDLDQMTDSGRNAFQVLCHYGIFKGVGDNKMDPTGVTTRAQFATLLHRISDFVASR